jgi:hypothetical protein
LQAIENECGLTAWSLKAALNQKGLRPKLPSLKKSLLCLKAALNQKGLRKPKLPI